MIIIRCKCCGREYDEFPMVSWIEEGHGYHTVSAVDDCHCCGGSIEEVEVCNECGEELVDGCCKRCLVNAMTKEDMIEYGDLPDCKQSVELNGYLVNFFGEELINDLLKTLYRCSTEKQDLKEWFLEQDLLHLKDWQKNSKKI